MVITDNPSLDILRKWAYLICKQTHRDDRANYVYEYFKRLRKTSRFIYDDNFIMCLTIQQDMFGDRYLNNLGCFVLNNEHRVKSMRRITKIMRMAHSNSDIEYSLIGSHFGDKFLKFFEKQGYKPCEYRKEV